jgi:spore germination protein GerM
MKMLAWAAVVCAASLVAGCGGSSSSSTAARADAAGKQQTVGLNKIRTTLYFLTDGGSAPLGVRRTVSRVDGTFARGALEALLAGPTAGEKQEGLSTAIPSNVSIRSFTIESLPKGSDANVDLHGLPPAQRTDAGLKVRVFTEITRTLVGLSDVARVWIRADGRPWGLWNKQGQVVDVPHDYRELLGFYQVCGSAPGTEATPTGCFSALP